MKTMKKKKYLKEHTKSTVGSSGAKGGDKVPRRSVTITDENNLRIRRTRGDFMSNDLEANYATVLNMLMELGYKELRSPPWSQETKQIIQKYLFDTALAEDGAIDEFMDIFNKKLKEEQLKNVPKSI